MKKFSLLLALLMLVVAVLPASAQAVTNTQAPGSWVSSINIQNTGTQPATVILRFYNSAGTEVYTDSTSISGANAIPVGGSRTIVLANDEKSLATGQYSVVVESSQPLEVIANSTSSGPVTAGAYQGVKQTDLSKTLYFPGLYNSYYGFSSEIVLQNSDTANIATVDIDFYNPSTGAIITAAHIHDTIPANSTRVFAMSKYSGVPAGNKTGILAAKVVSTTPIAGIVNNWSSTMFGEFSDYNGFAAGGLTLYAPGLYKNYYNFMSALTVQNVGTAPTNILVTYGNGTTESATLQPFQSIAYVQPNNASLPSGNTNGVFAAKIESKPNGSNAAQPIVALVTVENKVKGSLGSYNVPAAATASVGCPVLMKQYYGWYTGTTVQNVGTQTTNITITYASGQSKTYQSVAPNGSVAIVEGDTSVLPNTSAVSATITSSNNQPLVAVVQEDNNRYSAAPGDYLLAYTCVSK